jgi:hypothetical protein
MPETKNIVYNILVYELVYLYRLLQKLYLYGNQNGLSIYSFFVFLYFIYF